MRHMHTWRQGKKRAYRTTMEKQGGIELEKTMVREKEQKKEEGHER